MTLGKWDFALRSLDCGENEDTKRATIANYTAPSVELSGSVKTA